MCIGAVIVEHAGPRVLLTNECFLLYERTADIGIPAIDVLVRQLLLDHGDPVIERVEAVSNAS